MNDFYAAVFGAGIAGTAIANELAKREKNILLIDPFVSENAPGAPAGLVNPAAGRRANASWRSRECMDALRIAVDELGRSSGKDDLISGSGAIRPALTEELAENFREALDKYDWPEGWIRWMDPDEVSAVNPEIAPNFGALYLECGFTVYVDRYLNAYRRYLREKGVECRYERAEYHAGKSGGGFEIQFLSGEKTRTEHVVVAAGHKTPYFNDWEYLPLHRVKGQIVCFEADTDLNWTHATSAMGYCLRRGKRDLVVGSTYEHTFRNLETTQAACDRIREKLASMFPDIARRVRKKDQLAGVRVTSPDRLPVAGRHPRNENLCICTAMGSKGLLFSQYVAGLLAGHLVDDVAIPQELDTRRFDPGR